LKVSSFPKIAVNWRRPCWLVGLPLPKNTPKDTADLHPISTLAGLLVRASIPVTIFEGEALIVDRSQGGTLDLHTKTGLYALREARLYDDFLEYALYDGEAVRVVDKNLITYISRRFHQGT